MPCRPSSRQLVAFAILLSASAPRTATAQSDTDKLSAQEALLAATELRDKGDMQAALEKYKAAFGFAPTPITGYELGRAEADTGHLLAAYDALMGVERLPAKSNESQRSKDARASAAALAESLRPRMPAITVTVTGAKDGATLDVSLDGVALNAATLGAARHVDPGKHTLTAKTSAGQEARLAFEMAERETKALVVPLSAPVTPATPPPQVAVVESTKPPAPTPAPTELARPLFAAGAAAEPAFFAELGTIVGVNGAFSNSLSWIPSEIVLGYTLRWAELRAVGVLGNVGFSSGATFGAASLRPAARLPLRYAAVTLGADLGYFAAPYNDTEVTAGGKQTPTTQIGKGPWLAASLGVEVLPTCHFMLDAQADGGSLGTGVGGKLANGALFSFALGYRAGACK
jgi:hypothetical protein